MEQHFRELDEEGYTVLEGLLSPRQVERAIAALAVSYEEKHVSAHEPGTKRTHNLTARDEIFAINLLTPWHELLEMVQNTSFPRYYQHYGDTFFTFFKINIFQVHFLNVVMTKKELKS